MTDKPRMRQDSSGNWRALTSDGMQNLVAGIGSRSDKRSHNIFTFNFDQYSFQELEAAYLKTG